MAIAAINRDKAAAAVQAAYDRRAQSPGASASPEALGLQRATWDYELAKTQHRKALEAEQAAYEIMILEQSLRIRVWATATFAGRRVLHSLALMAGMAVACTLVMSIPLCVDGCRSGCWRCPVGALAPPAHGAVHAYHLCVGPGLSHQLHGQDAGPQPCRPHLL